MNNKFWIFALSLLLSACGGGGSAGDDPVVITTDFISVTPNLSLLPDGQEADLRISANCRWTISYTDSWLTVNPTSGNNSETVKVSAGKNSTGSDRTARLTISGGGAPTKTVIVTQSKSVEAQRLSASVESLSFEAKSETKTFTISSNTRWDISKPDWCTIDKTSGSGDATISVTVSENKDKEKRSGNIIINGEGVNSVTISINQKEREAGSAEPGSGDNTPPGV